MFHEERSLTAHYATILRFSLMFSERKQNANKNPNRMHWVVKSMWTPDYHMSSSAVALTVPFKRPKPVPAWRSSLTCTKVSSMKTWAVSEIMHSRSALQCFCYNQIILLLMLLTFKLVLAIFPSLFNTESLLKVPPLRLRSAFRHS